MKCKNMKMAHVIHYNNYSITLNYSIHYNYNSLKLKADFNKKYCLFIRIKAILNYQKNTSNEIVRELLRELMQQELQSAAS